MTRYSVWDLIKALANFNVRNEECFINDIEIEDLLKHNVWCSDIEWTDEEIEAQKTRHLPTHGDTW